MGHKFAEIAFTEQVKQVQELRNSRKGYANMEQGMDVNFLLSQREADFISARDSFYMASVSETNWPYVQHRGGPQGFLRVIDESTIGFADYSGNRQYVSTGNFRTNDRVSLILMDYPNRARLKILGRIKQIPGHDFATLSQVEITTFRAPVERGFIIHIEAFDWNCPKYITPRYSEQEVERLLSQLTEENSSLKKQLIQSSSGINRNTTNAIGDAPLQLKISGIRQLAKDIRAYELRDENHNELPEIEAGAHIQVPITNKLGEVEYRHYSISSNPHRRDIYEIAVKKEQEGRGGSQWIHQHYQLGMTLKCKLPENYFSLAADRSNTSVLIAGGIGITPIKSMALALKKENSDFTLHYAGKTQNQMAYFDRLKRTLDGRLHTYFSESNQRMDLAKICKEANENTTFYLCGPERLISEFKDVANSYGIDETRLVFEAFSKTIDADSKPITLKLGKSQTTIQVEKDESILDVLIKADIPIAYSCKTGHCRSCVVPVIEGKPQHKDDVLTDDEKASNSLICPCVSRAETSHLTLDL